MKDENLLQSADYQRERRHLAVARKAALLVPAAEPNQMWQLDLSDFETIAGGTWGIAGHGDYWSKNGSPWHISPPANQLDAIEAIELTLAYYQWMFGHPLADDHPIDLDTDELLPVVVVTLVTANGGPLRSFRFEAFVTIHPNRATCERE